MAKKKRKKKRKSVLYNGWAVIKGGDGDFAHQTMLVVQYKPEAVREQGVGEEVREIEFRFVD